MSDVPPQSAEPQPPTSASAQGPVAEYERRRAEAAQERSRLGVRSARLANARGLSFVLAAVALGFAAFGDAGALGWALGSVALMGFAVLVVLHDRVIRAETFAQLRQEAAQGGLARCTGRWGALPQDGRRFRDDAHPFAGDLDVFGPHSLFQSFNTARTGFGQLALARLLTGNSSLADVRQRQAAVVALVTKPALRTELEVLSSAQVGPRSADADVPIDLARLLDWAEAPAQLTPQRSVVWGARLLPPVLLLALLATRAWGLPWALCAALLGLQVWLMMRALPASSHAFAAVSSSPGAFRRLRPSLQQMENLEIDDPLLLGLRQRLFDGVLPASQQMARFERVLGWFELRHNAMIYPFVNALLLWDVHCVVALEAWQARSGRALRSWLQALGELEALCALATLAHDNPEYCFPELCEEGALFEAKGLSHPLLEFDKRVDNDVSLPGPGRALLVTGSNMSGKSTLLRSMGLAAVMAFAGGPVCARGLRIGGLRVFTSMRIHDSLSQGVSHFYAELQKLRKAVEATKDTPPVLFLLDEILHGTNSEERQVGARWVLAQLLEAGALGAVSTHDLGLCELSPHMMQFVETVHLKETVVDGRLNFDYRLRPGVVQGGNALRLMRSLGLAVPLA